MAIKFPRTANPKSVQESLITTPEAREAWEQLNHAREEYEKIDEAEELAQHRYKTAQNDYVQKMRDTAAEGGDIGKVKQPAAPTNDYDSHRQVWQERANAAAKALNQALHAAADDAVEDTLTELETAEQAFVESLNTAREAWVKLDTINRHRGYWRTVQGEVGLPSAPPNGSPATFDTATRDIARMAGAWRLADAQRRDALNEATMRIVTTDAEKAQHETKRLEIHNEIRGLLTELG